MTSTPLERIYVTLGIEPDNPEEIYQQIEREARYRRYVMTNEPNKAQRAQLIRLSTARSKKLNAAYLKWINER